MKVYVDMRDAPEHATAWGVTAAILDAVEPGASGHCLLRVPHLPAGEEEWHHHRLNVTIHIHARED
jgi:hypothetical protein